MKPHVSSPVLISFAFGVFVLVFALGFQVFAVWTSPTAVPPEGNVSAPLNVGTGNQIKSGGLWVGSLGVDGGIRINGGLTPPSCDNLAVGTIWNVPQNPVARAEGHLDICIQNGNGDYAWQKIIRGVGPSFIDVTPGTLGFGSYDQGTFADLIFAVKNTGEGPLTGSMTGLNSPFSCVSGCSYTNLTTNQTQNVTVRFAPTAWNSFNDTADLSGGGGAAVTVSGTGNPLPAAISVVPTTLDFGVILKGTSLDKTFTVSNAGEATLTGSLSGLIAPFSCITTPDCNYSLVGGANKVLTIRFAPSVGGTFADVVDLSGGGGASVPVSGIATDYYTDTAFSGGTLSNTIVTNGNLLLDKAVLGTVWNISYDTPKSDIYAFAFDSYSQVLYAGSNQSTIYRCNTSTLCNEAGDWTVAYKDLNHGSSRISSLVFDSYNRILYAAEAASVDNAGVLFRCDTAKFCDEQTDWTRVVSVSGQPGLNTLVFDSTMRVLYLGTGGMGTIYRCDTAKFCDQAEDFTVSYYVSGFPNVATIHGLGFDSYNNILYAGISYNNTPFGIYRCDTDTLCDKKTDWTLSYDIGYDVKSFVFDSYNRVLYAGLDRGAASGAIIYRCDTAKFCDQAEDWTVSNESSATGRVIHSFAFDSTSRVLYVGTDRGTIYRCDTAKLCDQAEDWTTTYIPPVPLTTNIKSLVFDSYNEALYGGGSVNGVIYRSARLFFSSGTFTSSAIDTGQASTFRTLTFNADIPSGTTLKFQLRSATTQIGLNNATWKGPDGTSGSYYTTSGTTIQGHNGNRWIQYQASFTPTVDQTQTSTLNNITINYQF